MELNESFEKTITDEKIERWRYPRFFTENIGKTAVLTPEDSKHISQVLRMKAGDYAVICDGDCNDYLCRVINPDKNAAELEILDKQRNEAEAGIYVRLFQCCPKSDKMEFIVQKAAELGACEVIPVLSKRCVSRPDSKSAEKKRERYQKIADEASKQCGRGRILKVMPMVTFEQAVKGFDKANTGILFYECGGQSINQAEKITVRWIFLSEARAALKRPRHSSPPTAEFLSQLSESVFCAVRPRLLQRFPF